MVDQFIFEVEARNGIWRLQDGSWQGKPRLQFWPWYRQKDSDELKPCAAKYVEGGFHLSPEDAVRLRDALDEYLREN